MIIPVSETEIPIAAEIHSASWIDAHRDFCDRAFLEQHSPENQQRFLQNERKLGKEFFMLVARKPVGIVSLKENLIENLYILPREQGKGYGTALLLFAISRCVGEPTLWILDNNEKAFLFYTKQGFEKTGKVNYITDSLSELEMKKRL